MSPYLPGKNVPMGRGRVLFRDKLGGYGGSGGSRYVGEASMFAGVHAVVLRDAGRYGSHRATQSRLRRGAGGQGPGAGRSFAASGPVGYR
jgi:hypothetical protein